jgi:hypothetical protein
MCLNMVSSTKGQQQLPITFDIRLLLTEKSTCIIFALIRTNCISGIAVHAPNYTSRFPREYKQKYLFFVGECDSFPWPYHRTDQLKLIITNETQTNILPSDKI